MISVQNIVLEHEVYEHEIYVLFEKFMLIDDKCKKNCSIKNVCPLRLEKRHPRAPIKPPKGTNEKVTSEKDHL